MNSVAKKVSRFGILTALALILGYLDRAIPLTSILGGAVPGIKLGLANTVLLYAVYLMDWQSSILLMLAKVILSGFLFGSLSAMMYSLAGGTLSLVVMMAVKKKPAWSAMTVFLLCAASDVYLATRYASPRGQVLWCMLLTGLAGIVSLTVFFLIRKNEKTGVIGTSLSGAVAHNIGQILVASWMLRTPQLLTSYLPFLAGIGACVGFLTGFIAQRVFHAMKRMPSVGNGMHE